MQIPHRSPAPLATARRILPSMWLLLLACTGDSDDTPPDHVPAYGEVLSDVLIGEINDLVAEGDRAYFCGEDGIRVYDIADPYNPTLYQGYYTEDPCYSANILNSRVLFGSQNAFRSFSPNNMMVRGEYRTNYTVQAFDISAGGNEAWLAGTDDDGTVWLEEVLYREDAAMYSQQVQSLDIAEPVALSALSDGLVLLDADGVLHTFNETLEHIGQWESGMAGSHLFLATGDTRHAYISQGTGGLAIVDLGVLSKPTLAATWPDDGGETFDVLLINTTLYIGRPDAVRVLDVSDPERPAPIGADDIELIGTPTRIWVDNRYAYLADSNDGLFSIVNLTP